MAGSGHFRANVDKSHSLTFVPTMQTIFDQLYRVATSFCAVSRIMPKVAQWSVLVMFEKKALFSRLFNDSYKTKSVILLKCVVYGLRPRVT